MPEVQKSQTGGMLVKGVDGDVYFIPDEAMSQFKLPEKINNEAKKLYEQGNKHAVVFGAIDGPLVRDQLGAMASDEKTVICTNTLQLRNLRSKDL